MSQEKPALVLDNHHIDIDINAINRLWNSSNFINDIKKFQQSCQHIIYQACVDGTSVKQCLLARSKLIDAILLESMHQLLHEYLDKISIFAVGGYGRQELHPYSDVDLVITHVENLPEKARLSIESFIRQCWDIGLRIGHIVATVKQCQELARVDSTQYNNMLERRPLLDKNQHHELLEDVMSQKSMWPLKSFLHAKIHEQYKRHAKYSKSAYALEPNIKSSPGGLRDIQTIFWLAKRCLKSAPHLSLIEGGYMSEDEYNELIKIRDFFWRVRFFLHTFSKRAEDRLLFDYQIMLADAYQYNDEKQHLRVEAFMKFYYQQVKSMRRLNESVIQRFEENLLHPESEFPAVKVDEHFQIRRDRLEEISQDSFQQNTNLVLKLFLHLAQRPNLRGISAKTLQSLQHVLPKFRQDAENQTLDATLFIQILKTNIGVAKSLRLMNKYGVLSAYIPEFKKIEGLMQFDLFHMYTVDSHTIQVIQHINFFLVDKDTAHCQLGVQLMRQCPNPELLYLAAIFHDIAKGRQGDHSELGAKDAYAFCQRHHLDDSQTKLIVWLIEFHLLMSITAQRKDISDITVIQGFAEKVNTVFYLNHLYIFTIADITATNPKLWNDWRHSLLKKLYLNTVAFFEKTLSSPDSKSITIQKRKSKSLESLIQKNYSKEKLEELFHNLGDDYFIRYTPHEITRHTPWLLKKAQRSFIRLHQHLSESATDIFLHLPYNEKLLSRVTTCLGNMNLNVVAARIVRSKDNFCLDTYTVLQQDNQPITSNEAMDRIKKRLKRYLIEKPNIVLRNKAMHKEEQPFRHHLSVTIEEVPHQSRSSVHIQANDRPLLLAEIAQTIESCDIRVLEAKIATMGDHIEDTFFVTNNKNQPLTKEEHVALKKALTMSLEAF